MKCYLLASVCQKHNIPFEYVEQEFATRYDVINEMFKIQFDRRNMTSRTKMYLVGKRYLIEKNVVGDNQYTNNSLNRVGQNVPSSERSSEKIAEQASINEKTVRRAADFTQAVDKIVQITGIVVNDILNGKITDPVDKIRELATKDSKTIQRIIDFVVLENITIAVAAIRVEKEDYNKQVKEAEERRKQVEKQQKEQREKEEAEAKELLRIVHEAKVKQENERLAKEKEEQEKIRLAEIERQKKEAEEKAKDAAELERIRK